MEVPEGSLTSLYGLQNVLRAPTCVSDVQSAQRLPYGALGASDGGSGACDDVLVVPEGCPKMHCFILISFNFLNLDFEATLAEKWPFLSGKNVKKLTLPKCFLRSNKKVAYPTMLRWMSIYKVVHASYDRVFDN